MSGARTKPKTDAHEALRAALQRHGGGAGLTVPMLARLTGHSVSHLTNTLANHPELFRQGGKEGRARLWRLAETPT